MLLCFSADKPEADPVSETVTQLKEIFLGERYTTAGQRAGCLSFGLFVVIDSVFEI